MSTPSSRLSKYRSYSYYHVLVMCDSSQTADELMLESSIEQWEHATPSTVAPSNLPGVTDLGIYAPKLTPAGGRYVVLINGSTDVAYSITSAKWETATAANAVPGDRGTSIAVEGTISISEPKGISFLDQVVKCNIALGIDSSMAVYCLKTFFVGFTTSDGIDGVDHITDIPPVMFNVYDVTGSFTEAGGTYEMLWVGISHGASRFSQYSKAVNAMSIRAQDSLEQTMKKLQDNINDSYERYFDCVYKQIGSISTADPTPMLKSLRRVKYVIEVGDDYKDGQDGQIKYRVTDQAQQFKNTSGCSDNAQITFPAHTSIETAISIIMSMCPQVKADAGTGDKTDQRKYEYKIHTTRETKKVDGVDENTKECTIYYRVERFPVPKTLTYEPAFQQLARENSELEADPYYQAIKRNIIEFDYVYTGKNTDVLEFDMKVNLGLAYMQTATLANTFKSQTERAPNKLSQTSVDDFNTLPVKFGGDAPPMQTFVFFGSQIKMPNITNVQDAGSTIQSAYTMNKHASLEVAEASMKIFGNDLFLAAANRTTSPGQVMRTVETTGPEYVDWSLFPVFAKVNIKMPRNNDDFSLFTGTNQGDSGSTDYATDFWFDGYYYIYGVEHSFEDGVFTQNLKMIGIPKKSAFDSTQSTNGTETQLTTSIDSCFDSKVGCGPSTAGGNATSGAGTAQSSVAVPEKPPASPVNEQGKSTVVNRTDSNSVLSADVSPDRVKGWAEATPRVRNAIIDASNRYGVSTGLLAMFAYKESNFREKIGASTSSATGLFQFIKSTWVGLVNQGKIVGLSDPNPDYRLDAYYNSYAGAAYIRDNAASLGTNHPGDLYLAHFSGPGTAKKIILADQSSGGSQLLSEALGKTAAAKMAKANPTIINASTTVGEIRTWAWRAMARTLIDGAQIAARITRPKGTVATVAVSSNVNASSRIARDQLAAQQDCAAQSKVNADQTRCGPTASDAPAASSPQVKKE